MIVMDWITDERDSYSWSGVIHGIRWKTTTTIDDLDFPDGVALLCSTKEQISWVKKLQDYRSRQERWG